jgi:hypothetical protein
VTTILPWTRCPACSVTASRICSTGLGVLQVRGVQGWIGDLAVRDPGEASRIVARRCERAGRPRADPEAIWPGALAELVSTGLFMLRLGHPEEAEAFLAVARKLTTDR